MGKMTDRQVRVLRRLAEAPEGDAVSYRGLNAIAGGRLAELGYAEELGPDKWAGMIFRITTAGRSALEEHNGKPGDTP